MQWFKIPDKIYFEYGSIQYLKDMPNIHRAFIVTDEYMVRLGYPGINHRLPELWTDPERFDPERFAAPRSEHKRHRYAFAPFGGGAHKCIGMVFGQFEIKTVMHRLLSRYRLELPHPGYRPTYDYGGMAVPVDGMPLRLRPL